ncbi:hypothetical protein [Moraxella lacunata]|uniref:hypothetical protein n=1 Tax=Moraxella lacunata TaxID=477 RepID=UPI003EE41F59
MSLRVRRGKAKSQLITFKVKYSPQPITSTINANKIGLPNNFFIKFITRPYFDFDKSHKNSADPSTPKTT